MLNVIVLSVGMLNVVMTDAVVLNVILPSVGMLNVIMLSVVAPLGLQRLRNSTNSGSEGRNTGD
jgi:hypothetical protein